MAISLWALFSLLGRVVLYASVASAIGGVFSSVLLARRRDSITDIARYIRYGCIVGILVALYNVWIEVGTLADRGLPGMMDTTILSVMLKMSVGHALALQLVGFLLIGGMAWVSLRQYGDIRSPTSLIISVLGGASLLASFSQVSHFAEAGLVGKSAISLHILAMSLWIGSLYPLWIVSRTTEVSAIQTSMEIFGRIAVFIVGLLVVCGIVMGVILIKDVHTLVSTGYGRGLLLKLMLVGSLLLLAASNKWLTVPHLHQEGFRNRLSRAIVLEMVLASLIFLVTGIITTIIGIE